MAVSFCVRGNVHIKFEIDGLKKAAADANMVRWREASIGSRGKEGIEK